MTIDRLTDEGFPLRVILPSFRESYIKLVMRTPVSSPSRAATRERRDSLYRGGDGGDRRDGDESLRPELGMRGFRASCAGHTGNITLQGEPHPP